MLKWKKRKSLTPEVYNKVTLAGAKKVLAELLKVTFNFNFLEDFFFSLSFFHFVTTSGGAHLIFPAFFFLDKKSKDISNLYSTSISGVPDLVRSNSIRKNLT